MSTDPDGGLEAKMNELKTNSILKHASEIILKQEKGFATDDEVQRDETECDRPRRTKPVRGAGAKTKLRKQNATDAAEIYEGHPKKTDVEHGKLDATNIAHDQKIEPAIVQDREIEPAEFKPTDEHPISEDSQGKRNIQSVIDRFDISSTSSTSSIKSGSHEPDQKRFKP